MVLVRLKMAPGCGVSLTITIRNTRSSSPGSCLPLPLVSLKQISRNVPAVFGVITTCCPVVVSRPGVPVATVSAGS